MGTASPLRLRLDDAALRANWRWLDRASGNAACGAAVKANGYGLGAAEVASRLADEGCRDFFVATWAEAAEVTPHLPHGCALSVLHGVREADMPLALSLDARPVLNSIEQIARWKPTGRACDLMADTGINRLGLAPAELATGIAAELKVETLMSHLASADEDSPQNARQLGLFRGLLGLVPAARHSLANSAGILLGADYHFGLTRPGLALYGGVPRAEAGGQIRQVAYPEAAILQRKRIAAGDAVGYNATFTAERPMELAILNIGYADGYLRGFSGRGSCGDGRFPVIGRVSMDLIAVSVDAEPSLREGDWLAVDYDLPGAARQSGLSQYELLTGIGQRLGRAWW